MPLKAALPLLAMALMSCGEPPVDIKAIEASQTRALRFARREAERAAEIEDKREKAKARRRYYSSRGGRSRSRGGGGGGGSSYSPSPSSSPAPAPQAPSQNPQPQDPQSQAPQAQTATGPCTDPHNHRHLWNCPDLCAARVDLYSSLVSQLESGLPTAKATLATLKQQKDAASDPAEITRLTAEVAEQEKAVLRSEISLLLYKMTKEAHEAGCSKSAAAGFCVAANMDSYFTKWKQYYTGATAARDERIHRRRWTEICSDNGGHVD